MRATAHGEARRLPLLHSARGRTSPARVAAEHESDAELALFSDRLDEAAEFQKIIHDFVCAHEAQRAADDYDG